MTLPANDAFSLGLAHDQHRRSHSLSRSTSPKVSFSSSTKSTSFSPHNSVQANGMKRNGKRRVSSRQNSLHLPDGAPILQDASNSDDLRTLVQKDTDIKSSRNTPNGGRTIKKHVDWEIPRKILHSSIGFFTIYLYTSHGSPRHVVVVLSTALAFIVPADILRLRYPTFERTFEKCVGFLMRESEKKSSNGVIWYILGVNFALLAYPLDIAVVAILILSWADTAASTFGRLFGSYTPPLPRRLPILCLPLAPRKSLAGFIAASITGACIAASFWTWVGPMRYSDLSWSWDQGVSTAFVTGQEPVKSALASIGMSGIKAGGWLGLSAITLFAGMVSGVAEALDLGSLDDNMTLPIIAGGCLCGLFKFFGWFA
ncbi:hypothetical protein SERLA73DRAFT_191940 [Serpula lacrymans var. lacrymans S7.3]|uniref:Phosphatidate cytidylyltransferase n=2 Tax=Serpula lacrymans var. lacrymans TaxID=341189 RepID=F8QIN1_SERL3|nr:uncharacterized protein SERLADRAFT_414556 [Serpula lacrymans var. lacrymans S7.9]EGN91833.1 hypothetical protein SERLA73DRAFT_191940 [Serpula lacrymans var. lacrymans S7.3]EGO26586.1 hypothetical protein SERLADRAFT_414556 [Serpula lacrymans var. lacrymans S7.9]